MRSTIHYAVLRCPDFPFLGCSEFQQTFTETPRVDVKSDADPIAEEVVDPGDAVHLLSRELVWFADRSHLGK